MEFESALVALSLVVLALDRRRRPSRRKQHDDDDDSSTNIPDVHRTQTHLQAPRRTTLTLPRLLGILLPTRVIRHRWDGSLIGLHIYIQNS